MDDQKTKRMSNEDVTIRLERDINSLANRFDRHLEIYAQNGKELAALKSQVANNHGSMLTALDTLNTSIGNLRETISKQDEQHVGTAEFKPVKGLVYGVVGLILIGVMSAVIGLVVLPQQGLSQSDIEDILNGYQLEVVQ